MNPVTVWSALAISQAVIGGIVWIDPNTFQPTVDGLNLYWDSTNTRLFVKTAGDFSGTDAINTGGEVDSFKVQGFAIGTVGSAPGFSASSSRGSSVAPTVLLDTDPIGVMGGFGYFGDGAVIAKNYYEAASIRYYVKGNHATYAGGEMRFGTKGNNAGFTEWLRIDEVGHFSPMVTGTSRLGTASKGFAALTLDFTHTATIGAVVMNKPSGSVNIGAGASSVVVTNSLVTANSIIIPILMFVDATLTSIKSCIPAAGSFTITGNNNATANTKVGFLVINTDS